MKVAWSRWQSRAVWVSPVSPKWRPQCTTPSGPFPHTSSLAVSKIHSFFFFCLYFFTARTFFLRAASTKPMWKSTGYLSLRKVIRGKIIQFYYSILFNIYILLTWEAKKQRVLPCAVSLPKWPLPQELKLGSQKLRNQLRLPSLGVNYGATTAAFSGFELARS